MSKTQSPHQLLRSIRIWLSIFIVGLILSGVTAFPLEHETGWLVTFATAHAIFPEGISLWLVRVHGALHENSIDYPFLAYGTDWLAFAHLVLAVVFLGPLRDPSATSGCSSSASSPASESCRSPLLPDRYAASHHYGGLSTAASASSERSRYSSASVMSRLSKSRLRISRSKSSSQIAIRNLHLRRSIGRKSLLNRTHTATHFHPKTP